MTNYIKALTGMPRTWTEWQSSPTTMGKADEQIWFFDDTDPAQVSGAERRAITYRDRFPGQRVQLSLWQPCSSLPGYQVIGEPTPARRRWAA